MPTSGYVNQIMAGCEDLRLLSVLIRILPTAGEIGTQNKSFLVAGLLLLDTFSALKIELKLPISLKDYGDIEVARYDPDIRKAEYLHFPVNVKISLKRIYGYPLPLPRRYPEDTHLLDISTDVSSNRELLDLLCIEKQEKFCE